MRPAQHLSHLQWILLDGLRAARRHRRQEDPPGAARDGHTDLAFGNPDFLKLAEAFDWAGYRCESSVELLATLDQAFAQDRPALVVVPIDYRENALLTERLGQIELDL